MARPRRPRGPDLRGTLGTLVRSTLAQAGVFRDVLERGAREGRARLDDVRRDRKRTDALAHLGLAVMESLRAGEMMELLELPHIAEAVADVEALDDEPTSASPPWTPTSRARWDRDREPALDRDHDRARELDRAGDMDRARDGDREPPRTRDRGDEPGARFREGARGDDGTVSSSGWRPPPRPAVNAGANRVWRPHDPDATPASTTSPTRTAAPAPPPPPPRAGGIQFGGEDDDEDEDLSAYMNPDDVPPRKP